jgi:hypothetical protein
MSNKWFSGNYTKSLTVPSSNGWTLFCWSNGNNAFSPDKQFTVTATCGVAAPPPTPGFTLSANSGTVRAKSLAGYSGVTEKDILISVNPVAGFNTDVKIEVDTSSLPPETKPTYSFAGGAYTENPSAVMKLDGGLYKVGGSIYLPVSIRFGGTLKANEAYMVRFKGTALPGGVGAGSTASINVTIDSKPLYPGFEEI